MKNFPIFSSYQPRLLRDIWTIFCNDFSSSYITFLSNSAFNIQHIIFPIHFSTYENSFFRMKFSSLNMLHKNLANSPFFRLPYVACRMKCLWVVGEKRRENMNKSITYVCMRQYVWVNPLVYFFHIVNFFLRSFSISLHKNKFSTSKKINLI